MLCNKQLTVEPWSKKSSNKTCYLSQSTIHMIFRMEKNLLNFVLFSNEVCLLSKDCHLDSDVLCNTHVLSYVTICLKICLLYTSLQLLSFAIENTLDKKTLQVNYPFPLTDLHQKQ